ncbi:hypothetical protein D3C78_1089400 [compost metagenome]
MDVAVGEKFRPRADRRQHHQIAAVGIDLLAAADRTGDDQGRLHLGLGRLGFLGRLCWRWLGGCGFDRLGQWPLAPAGRGQQRQAQLFGRRDVAGTAGARAEGQQAMAVADIEQAAEIQLGIRLGEMLETEQHGRVVEEVGRLGDLLGQLPVEECQVVAGKLQHGDREHVALEPEYGVLVGQIS